MTEVPKLAGRWRIVETDLGDQDAIDLLGPAFIEFTDGQQGGFRFIAVEDWMDVRPPEHHGSGAVEFSWEGHAECDPASGRGCALVAGDGSLRGRTFFHLAATPRSVLCVSDVRTSGAVGVQCAA